jgi:hypothetical protein
MKIDIVLTSCNLNTYYLNLYPYVFKVWKERFNLDLYLILISDVIPDNLLEYKKFIILFEPIPKINTTYIAQVIRILYPCLFNNLNILITDIDIFPISKKYFLFSIENYSNEQFVAYTNRYIKNNMIAICYNIANSNVWKKIFNIENIIDINNILISNYNENYTGKKNCEGWYTDQQLLFNYIMEYIKKRNNDDINNVIFLNDIDIGYKRLDGKSANKLLEIKNNQLNILDNIDNYSDFHIIRNYNSNLKLFEDIIQAIVLLK